MNGQYDEKFKPISAAIRAIEAEHGLSEDEYWPLGEGPASYRKLSNQYGRVLKRELEALFRSVGLRRHARLWMRDTVEFFRLREAGRANVFEPSDVEHAASKLIEFYEAEAKRCLKSKAFHAACVMLGSACESLILLRCERHAAQVEAAKAKIPKSKRFHKGGPRQWNLAQLAELAKQAGWLANIETTNAIVHIVNLMAHLQRLRNMVHAGRHAIDMPHISIGKEQYADAWAAYLALRCAFDGSARDKI